MFKKYFLYFLLFLIKKLKDLFLGRNHTPLSRAGKPTVAAASAGGQTQRGDREDDGIRDIVVKQEWLQSALPLFVQCLTENC